MKKKLISLAMLVTVFAMQVVGVSAASKTATMAVVGNSKGYYEVDAMDQVMLKFVGQRGEERIEQQARPPGHVPGDVERCAADHPGQGEGQDARAQCVLMLEYRVALTQFDALGQHHFANMC